MLKKRIILAAAAAVAASGMAVSMVSTEPADDELVIDGEKQMVTRTAAPEDHPLDEVLSGWLYRTPETRALEADSFQNPGMLYVERGEEIWNTVEGEAGKSCASCHVPAATRS